MSLESDIKRFALTASAGLIGLGSSVACGVAVQPGGIEQAPQPPTPTLEAGFTRANCDKLGITIPLPTGWHFSQRTDSEGVTRCFASEQPSNVIGQRFDTGVTLVKVEALTPEEAKRVSRNILTNPILPTVAIGDLQERQVSPFTILERRLQSATDNKLRVMLGRIVVDDRNVYGIFAETTRVDELQKFPLLQKMLDGIVVEGKSTR